MTQFPGNGGNQGSQNRPPGQPNQPGQGPQGWPGNPPPPHPQQRPGQGPGQGPGPQGWPPPPPLPPGPQGWPQTPPPPGPRQQPPQGYQQRPPAPHQWPAQGQGQGPGYPAPPRKSGGRGKVVAWIAAAAALVLLAGAAVVGLVAFGPDGSSNDSGKNGQKKPQVNPAVVQTRTAALDLARQPAARYTGELTTTGGSDVPVDLTVTNSGTTNGKLGSGTDSLELLVMGGKSFFKASAAFWKDAGATTSRIARYANRWVRVEAGYIGIDPEQRLAPRIISAELIKAADAGKVSGTPTSKNGVNARPVTIPQGTVYISTEAPYRVIHIDTETTQDPGGGLTPATYADESSFDLDVAYLTEPVANSLFNSLKVNVSQLINAIDSQVDFDLDGSVVLAPCTASGCTATATLSNKVRGSDTYVRADQPIIVEVIIAFTLDARPIRSCTDVVTMVANGKTRTSCRVTYSLPADGSRHTIRAQVSGFAKAMSAADVAKLLGDLNRQALGWRVRQAGDAGLPDGTIGNGKYQFRPPATYRPNTGSLAETDGGYLDVVGNLWTQAPAKGLAAKKGYTHEWVVKLSDEGLQAWQDAAKDGNVNVTPHGDISH